jgi:antiviral helicase SLH1
VDDFALVSDTAYAAQNGGRITRALLEIAISSKWASVTATLLGLSQAIEKRLWPTDQPLKQFDLKPDIVYGLDTWAREWSVYDLASQSAADLGKLVHLNEKHGQAILNAAKQFPTVLIDYGLRPLCSDVLKIVIQVKPAFTWTSKVHGSTEPFWLWVEDHEGSTIIQISHLILRPTTESLGVDFVIPIAGGVPPPFVTIRFVSDRWMGAEDEVSIQLDGLIMPPPSKSHSPTLDLPLLSLSSLRNPTVEALFSGRINSFNSLQTHVFWSLMHTQMHTLICAPGSCGKSLLGLVLVWSVPNLLMH